MLLVNCAFAWVIVGLFVSMAATMSLLGEMTFRRRNRTMLMIIVHMFAVVIVWPIVLLANRKYQKILNRF
ncbi:hypothetical protein MPK71_gp058 [Erwinia phage pEa_SNUABM_1]|uniref:Uncharacterized protein n=1 Tax=Erwinia phage pEa_SNUABM_1 TaxID=2869543 RepID=A0AAE8BZQ2_9CAUD|nr:hypothetical protein MPK71_gp058 [Erwinia phage pEa_SNUABM_1]QZE57267.1 hypothetical protein pEaSNUABM1_00058 [Erwinia phage pEa_SNUABM_1]